MFTASARMVCSTASFKLVKNKAFPLQAWRSPEDSRRLRLLDFQNIST